MNYQQPFMPSFPNQFYGGFQTQAYQQPQSVPNYAPQPPQQATLPLTSNKTYVASMEDAISRTTMPNSEMLYVHQDKPQIIQIKTDMQGKKTAQVFDITVHKDELAPENQPPVDYVTREEYNKLYDQIRDIQKSVQDIADMRRNTINE